MTGNPRKGGFWNKPGTVSRQAGRGGSSSADYQDACTLEETVAAARRIKARSQRDDHEYRTAKRAATERAKITLPSLQSLTKLMKED